ncbi:MAG: hypothetical protein PW788_05140 [Micavibrio sp.]|nr:hypothetical protein [Micavibrio sp.]
MVAIGGGRRVLLVGGEGVVLYGPSGKGIEREMSISWEVPNFDDQLAEGLRSRNIGKSVLIIFDGADQTYRKEENIPKLSPIDRPRFVKRKLELAFPSYPIRASLEIKSQAKKKGFSATKAPETPRSYLFVALPETEQLDRIGNAMYEASVPVSGFGLLPLESTGLVAELSEKLFAGRGRKSRWAMIIGQHETGGLRQVVIKDGNLALTRLTPTSDSGSSGTGWVEEVTREFKATLTYVSRFGYTEADGLDVIIICGDIEKQFFDAKSMPVTNFQCLNVSEALKTIGAKSFGLDKGNFSDALHAAWAAKKGGLKLSVRIPSIHRVQAPRLAARAGMLLLGLGVLGLLGLSAIDIQQYASLQGEVGDKENQKTMLSREYDEEAKAFDGLEMKPEAVKSVMNVKQLLENNTINLRHVLHTFKNTLPSDVRIESLSLSHKPAAVLKLDAAAGSAAMFNFGPPPDPKDKGQITLNFKFTLPHGMALEQKVARAEELQKTLSDAFKGYDVSIVHQFEDVNREGVMSGVLANSNTPAAVTTEATAEIQLKGAPL